MQKTESDFIEMTKTFNVVRHSIQGGQKIL